MSKTKTPALERRMGNRLKKIFTDASSYLTDTEIAHLIELLTDEQGKRKQRLEHPERWQRQDGPQPQRLEKKSIHGGEYYYLRFDWKNKKRSWYVKNYVAGDPIPFVTYGELEQWEQKKIRGDSQDG